MYLWDKDDVLNNWNVLLSLALRAASGTAGVYGSPALTS